MKIFRQLAKAVIPQGIRSAIRHEQQRRRWTCEHRAGGPGLEVIIRTNSGLGDVMIARQLKRAFDDALRGGRRVPGVRRMVITGGMWGTMFRLPEADLQVYWWWSMGRSPQWLDEYLSEVSHRPDLILSLSRSCSEELEQRALPHLFLPLATGSAFTPPDAGAQRSGVGYAGSRGHKDAEQEAIVVRPFMDRPDFYWVDNLKTPEELAGFYRQRELVLGMTERLQESRGMLNNRVFEVLATDTPFILSRHRYISEFFGLDYPYQTASAQETLALQERITQQAPGEARELARHLGDLVRREHTWSRRIAALLDHLEDKA